MKRVSDPRPVEIAEQLLQGDRRALARAITMVEQSHPKARELLALLFPHGGKAHMIGITGAPGTGKSSLVNVLAKGYRRRGLTVSILAVDPSSPFTGGALLGDRLRMRDLCGDSGVFIRSMATRGATGGLSRVTADAVHILDAAGYDRIFIETVGAGQDEVEVARLAHTVIVVEAPGLGDDIQAIKAGILETANILVLNKADRDGAEQTLAALRMMLEMANPSPSLVTHHGTVMPVNQVDSGQCPGHWQPPLVSTVAIDGQGVDSVIDAIEAHRQYLATDDKGSRLARQRAEAQLNRALDEALRRFLAAHTDPAAYQQALERIVGRVADPHSAAEWLVGQMR